MSNLSAEDTAALEKFGKAYNFKAPKLSNVAEVFHYCSPETLNAIVCNKTIRSSDLSKMNDFMELKWGLDIIRSEIDNVKDTISEDLADRIHSRIAEVIDKSRFLISCFSEHGDILSQWRAYASDGEGFSVGFDAKKLAKAFKHLGPVIYSEDLQRSLVRERVIAGSSIWHQCSEQGLELCFQVRNGLLTPFSDIDFSEYSDIVKKVIMGPKNNNEEADIKAFFQKNGLKRPQISKSTASYR